MFFTFQKDAHWTDRQAVEFGVEIGEYRGACSDATSSAAHPRALRRGLPPAEPVRGHRRVADETVVRARPRTGRRRAHTN